MSGDGDDWSDSLFQPKKGDSLGDGSWGQKSDEPKLAPVAWDKLPDAPTKKPRARLATPAPGSQKESGLLDIKKLAPDLAKGMKLDQPGARQLTPPPGGGGARLATEAKGSSAAGSGLIDVPGLVKLQEDQAAKDKESLDVFASNAAASMSGSSLSSSLVDQPAVPLEESNSALELPPQTNRGPLMVIVFLLAAAVAGLVVYVITQ